MSHIVEFTIKGLAGRKIPIHCKLDRHLNVIYGLNGSGKTSLIKILHSAMTGDPSSIQNVPFISATVKIYSITHDKIFTRKIARKRTLELFEADAPAEIESHLETYEFIQLNLLKKEKEPGFRWSEEPKIDRKDDLRTTRWRHSYLPTSRLHVVEGVAYLPSQPRSREERVFTEEELDAVFAESLERLWSHYSAELLLAIRHAQEDGLARILELVLTPADRIGMMGKSAPDAKEAYACLKNFIERQRSSKRGSTKRRSTKRGSSIRQYSAKLLGDYKTFQKRFNQEPHFQLVVADIHKVEHEIQEAMAPRNKLQSLIGRLYTGAKHVKFGDRSIIVKDAQDNPISLASLSSGEKHLMRILVETLLVEQNSMMIDEPEISMHIDWQRELLGTMNALNPHAQFIVATHSPEIMANVPDERIISL